MERKNRPLQALTLAVITTVVAELFFGTTPVSRAFILIPQLIYYGSASILIREIARRQNRPWFAVVFLGLAFACIEEGLTLQSFFNPHFLGIDVAQGRVAGINTLWTLHSLGYHCFWSICTSLLITELIFSKTAAEPWVGKAALWVLGVLFCLVCFGLNAQFKKMSGFNTAPAYYLGTACLVIILLFAAFKISPLWSQTDVNQSRPGFWMITLITFLIGASWLFGMFIQYILPNGSPLISLGLALITILAGAFVLRYWSASAYWDNTAKGALACGMIAAELLLGYFITQNNPIDHVGHIVVIVIAFALLFLLVRKLQSRAKTLPADEIS